MEYPDLHYAKLLTITMIAISIECETRITGAGIGSNFIFTVLITLLYANHTLINICYIIIVAF